MPYVYIHLRRDFQFPCYQYVFEMLNYLKLPPSTSFIYTDFFKSRIYIHTYSLTKVK